MFKQLLQRVSQAPTNPKPSIPVKEFDVADLYRGPVTVHQTLDGHAVPLDDELRELMTA